MDTSGADDEHSPVGMEEGRMLVDSTRFKSEVGGRSDDLLLVFFLLKKPSNWDGAPSLRPAILIECLGSESRWFNGNNEPNPICQRKSVGGGKVNGFHQCVVYESMSTKEKDQESVFLKSFF